LFVIFFIMILLPRSFYLRPDVVIIARELIGKYLVTRMEGILSCGMITETEAYEGATDRASHAYGNRFTERTKVMYEEGGIAYVYLCYGIHSMFNIVTNRKGIPHAILVRAIRPEEGLDVMRVRSGKTASVKGFGDGPGKVAQILGIRTSHSGIDLTVIPAREDLPAIWIEDRGTEIPTGQVERTSRIGVGYAGDDARLPYRFRLRG
jgi:DNA-3-methyladenine glycosylase